MFTMYDAMSHLQGLQMRGVVEDDDWNRMRKIVPYRLMTFHKFLGEEEDIEILTNIVHDEFCEFTVFHKPTQIGFKFSIHRSTDDAYLISHKFMKAWKSLSAH